MAKKRHLEQCDSSGNTLEIYLNDDEVMTSGGQTLQDKLGDIDEALGDAGKGSVNAVKVGEDVYTPNDEGVVDLGEIVGEPGADGKDGADGKSAYEIAVEEGFEGDEAAWLASLKGADGKDGADGQDGQDGAPGKDGADGAPGAPGADGEDGADGADGKSAYQSYYDTTSDNPKMTEAEWAAAVLRSAYRSYLATTSDNPKMTESQWVASLKGEKGDQGDTVVLDTEGLPMFKVVNDLTTGGGGDALSAEMGARLKQNVDVVQANIVNLYNKLANLAFLTAADKAAVAPTPLDWSVPKVDVTITNSIGNDAVIKRNGQTIVSPLPVDQGEELVLTIEPAAGKEFSSIAATVDGVSTALTESGGVYTLNAGHVNAVMTIVVSGTAQAKTMNVSIVTSNVAGALGLSGSTVQYGGTFEEDITVLNSNYNDFQIASVVDAGGNSVNYTLSGNTITIANVTSDITITASAEYKLNVWFGKSLNAFGAMVDDADACCTDYIQLSDLDFNTNLTLTYKFTSRIWFPDTQLKQCMVLYDKNKKIHYVDGAYEVVRVPSNLTNNTGSGISRSINASWIKSLFSSSSDAPLYARFSFHRESGQNVITPGVGLVQSNVNLIEASVSNYKAASLSEAYSQHNITYQLSNVAIDSTQASNWTGVPSIQDGQPMEIAIRATSGNINDAAISVTMGGVDITNDSTKVTISSKTASNTAYKVIRIEAVTADVVINASIS